MSGVFTADAFAAAWRAECDDCRQDLLAVWPNNALFTRMALSHETSVIKRVATRLGLGCYCEYYSMDAVLYLPEDRISLAPPHQTWLRRIRVAFEHENDFRSGLYKEIGHLLITKCDHRVLVTYSSNDAEIAAELKSLHTLVSETGHAASMASSGGLQIIIGSKSAEEIIAWRSFVYRADKWREE